jgi:hypothetical protein
MNRWIDVKSPESWMMTMTHEECPNVAANKIVGRVGHTRAEASIAPNSTAITFRVSALGYFHRCRPRECRHLRAAIAKSGSGLHRRGTAPKRKHGVRVVVSIVREYLADQRQHLTAVFGLIVQFCRGRLGEHDTLHLGFL